MTREPEECGHPKSRDLHPVHITGDERGLHSSVVDLLTRVLLVSAPAQRSNALREEGPLNIDMCAHQSMFAFFTSFLSIHPCNSMLHIHRFTWHSVF